MRLSWIRGRGMVALAAAIALQGATAAFAQFVPYNGNANQGYSQYQANAPQQVQTYVPQQVQAYVPQQAQQQQIQPQQAQPQYVAPQQVQPQYVAMNNGTQVLNQGAEVLAPVPMQSGMAAPAANCNCQGSGVANYSPASMSYGNTYNTFDNGCGIGANYAGNAGCGVDTCGLGGARCGSGRQWFGGFYSLFMERTGNPWRALAFSTTDITTGYYPADSEVVLNLTSIDNDTFTGAEVRFGATLGSGGCGCNRYAWEFGYWGLLEDDQSVTITDLSTDSTRLYGMLGHTGAFYNGRSVNDYYDYGPPVANPAGDVVRLRSLTARNTFSMQNMELNLLRLPLCGGNFSAGGGAGYGAGLARRGRGGRGLGRRGGAGGCAVGGCDVGGCDPCAGGSCGVGGGCCGASRLSMTGVFGVRYLRIDEDFMYRANFENETASTTGYISHSVDVDNHLVGAQFGCNAIYRCGCSGRWALHCNSVVGVYGNHSEVWNRMDAPTSGGNVTLQNGDNFNLRYEDDNIAMIGELRVGGSYQYSCNWRMFGGYRLLGVSGVALAFDQISDANISAAQTSYVNSNSSIFTHGIQTGIECTY